MYRISEPLITARNGGRTHEVPVMSQTNFSDILEEVEIEGGGERPSRSYFLIYQFMGVYPLPLTEILIGRVQISKCALCLTTPRPLLNWTLPC